MVEAADTTRSASIRPPCTGEGAAQRSAALHHRAQPSANTQQRMGSPFRGCTLAGRLLACQQPGTQQQCSRCLNMAQHVSPRSTPAASHLRELLHHRCRALQLAHRPGHRLARHLCRLTRHGGDLAQQARHLGCCIGGRRRCTRQLGHRRLHCRSSAGQPGSRRLHCRSSCRELAGDKLGCRGHAAGGAACCHRVSCRHRGRRYRDDRCGELRHRCGGCRRQGGCCSRQRGNRCGHSSCGRSCHRRRRCRHSGCHCWQLSCNSWCCCAGCCGHGGACSGNLARHFCRSCHPKDTHRRICNGGNSWRRGQGGDDRLCHHGRGQCCSSRHLGSRLHRWQRGAHRLDSRGSWQCSSGNIRCPRCGGCGHNVGCPCSCCGCSGSSGHV